MYQVRIEEWENAACVCTCLGRTRTSVSTVPRRAGMKRTRRHDRTTRTARKIDLVPASLVEFSVTSHTSENNVAKRSNVSQPTYNKIQIDKEKATYTKVAFAVSRELKRHLHKENQLQKPTRRVFKVKPG